MPDFAYRAKKGPTEIVSGQVTAQNLEEAVEQLDRLGLLPIHLDEVKPGAPKSETKPVTKSTPAPAVSRPPVTTSAPLKKNLFGGVKSSEITIFGRQLSSLVKSGVPILRALWIISE